MSIADGLVSELKIADVLTFLTVHRCGSISGAARELMVTPSQVSKSIGRLEDLLGTVLFSRSASGISLLDEGRRVIPQFEQMLELARTLRGQATAPRSLGFAAPSYLASFVVPAIAAATPAFRIRVLELPPAQIRAHLSAGHFDVAISLGELPLAASWEGHQVGEIEKALFCAPDTAAVLGPGPISRDQLATLPIISPIYLTDTGFLPVDDDCPITRLDRNVGHETTTFALGLAIAARSNQLVYGPVVGALPFLDAGSVVKLDVEGWRSCDPLTLAYNTDRVTLTDRRLLVSTLEAALASIHR